MNKLLVIYGSVLLGSAPVAEPQESTVPVIHKSTEFTRTLENSFTAIAFDAEVVEEGPLYVMDFNITEPGELNLNKVTFIEEIDEEVELGFDTSEYLPKGFNPYEVYFDLNSVEYVEVDTEIDLGFDTTGYLPEGFDPYIGSLEVNSINFVEEEVIDLGFDTENYLPEDFNPYEIYFDVNSIEFIEEEEKVELGFDTSKYLPGDFDPYASTSDVDSINYIELDEMNVDFDI